MNERMSILQSLLTGCANVLVKSKPHLLTSWVFLARLINVNTLDI